MKPYEKRLEPSPDKNGKRITRRSLLILAMLALNISFVTVVVAQNLLTAKVTIPGTIQFKVSSATLIDTTSTQQSSCTIVHTTSIWNVDCASAPFPIAQGDSLGLSINLDNPSPARSSTISISTIDTGIVFTSATATTSGTTTNQCANGGTISTPPDQQASCSMTIPQAAPAVNVTFGFTDNSISTSTSPLTLTIQ